MGLRPLKIASIDYRLLLGFILVIAALIRLVTLPTVGSLSFDEAWSVWIAKKSIPSALTYIASDKHPPLFYFVLAAWVRLFGDGELVIRLLSALFGIGGVACVYFLGRSLFNNTTGLIAALLMAASPFQVFYSQETRMYPMAQVFVLLSAWLLWKVRQEDRFRNWVFYFLATLALVYTHYIAALSLVGQAAFLFVDVLRNRQRMKVLKKWFITILAIALPGAFWVPKIFNQVVLQGGAPQWIQTLLGTPSIKDFFLLFLRDFLIPFPEYPRLIRFVIYLACVVLFLITFFKFSLKPPRLRLEISDGTLLCAFGVVIPVSVVWVISQFDPTFVTRYFLPLSGFFYLLLAQGIQKISYRILRWSVIALIVGIIAIGSLDIIQSPRERDWRSIAGYIQSNWQKDDVLIIVPPANWIVFSYYTKDQINRDLPAYKLFYPSYPDAPDESELSHNLLDQPLSYRRLWWIDEHGTGLAVEWQVDPDTKVQEFLKDHFSQQPIPTNLSGFFGDVVLYKLDEKK